MPTAEESSGRTLGVCNFCNELTRVYEQEDEYRSLFILCMRCIKDITSAKSPYDLYRDPEE